MSLLRRFAFGDPESRFLFNRRPRYDRALADTVARIIDEVATEGESAVLRHTRQFDSPLIETLWHDVPDGVPEGLAKEDQAALDLAARRIQDFHEVQLSTHTDGWEELPKGWGWRMDAIEDGEDTGFEGQRMLPLASAGVYVPGGKASYPSSVLMNAIPALVAGVERVAVCTPPRPDGSLNPAVLYACYLAGVDRVALAGGASAIALMALGCEGFDRVDKVVGPGNTYVNEAKRQLWGSVGVDSYAGPSEVAVFADGSCAAQASALDLLTQVEHAEDNIGLLICQGEQVAAAIEEACEALLRGSERESVMRAALAKHGACLIVDSPDQAITVLNQFAPEHCSLHCGNAGWVAQQVVNCGCVLIGPDSPQSAGDYVSGPSHTLPTSGAARFASPVSVLDFLKVQSVSSLTRTDLIALSPAVERFGFMEGLPMHGRGGSARLD